MPFVIPNCVLLPSNSPFAVSGLGSSERRGWQKTYLNISGCYPPPGNGAPRYAILSQFPDASDRDNASLSELPEFQPSGRSFAANYGILNWVYVGKKTWASSVAAFEERAPTGSKSSNAYRSRNCRPNVTLPGLRIRDNGRRKYSPLPCSSARVTIPVRPASPRRSSSSVVLLPL